MVWPYFCHGEHVLTTDVRMRRRSAHAHRLHRLRDGSRLALANLGTADTAAAPMYDVQAFPYVGTTEPLGEIVRPETQVTSLRVYMVFGVTWVNVTGEIVRPEAQSTGNITIVNPATVSRSHPSCRRRGCLRNRNCVFHRAAVSFGCHPTTGDGIMEVHKIVHIPVRVRRGLGVRRGGRAHAARGGAMTA
ncbi:hypothetical protein OsJ_36151 [Oryza sativa Japonica Group]|uniref:Uncharacterized protein n=1 Tax=Oryza sativa subsp. japonica TaxID=39947 RepID=B9GD87_ORYSJ|nr:hypothetical protein OsJ_36151 [Oryza sativa Japonica Group]